MWDVTGILRHQNHYNAKIKDRKSKCFHSPMRWHRLSGSIDSTDRIGTALGGRSFTLDCHRCLKFSATENESQLGHGISLLLLLFFFSSLHSFSSMPHQLADSLEHFCSGMFQISNLMWFCVRLIKNKYFRKEISWHLLPTLGMNFGRLAHLCVVDIVVGGSGDGSTLFCSLSLPAPLARALQFPVLPGIHLHFPATNLWKRTREIKQSHTKTMYTHFTMWKWSENRRNKMKYTVEFCQFRVGEKRERNSDARYIGARRKAMWRAVRVCISSSLICRFRPFQLENDCTAFGFVWLFAWGCVRAHALVCVCVCVMCPRSHCMQFNEMQCAGIQRTLEIIIYLVEI